jgi:MAternally-affected-uncoordination protein
LLLFTVLAALYRELDERGNEMENAEYQRKKVDDLQRRLADAHSSIHHIELVRAVVYFCAFNLLLSIADI